MIYLIAGESNQLINGQIKDIIGDCPNIIFADYNNLCIDDILAEASYYSMFNDKKVIVVKNANFFSSDKITEENSNKLLNYFSHPNDLTTLIFTINNKLDMRKKITKEIKNKHKLINISNLNIRDINILVKDMFKKDGFIIDEESINYIITNNANNYDLIYNEVNKIKLYYNNPCKILYDDVINIVAKSLDTNNFKFVEFIVNKEIKQAFKLYEDLKLLKVEPLALISLIAREYRLMLFAKLLRHEHYMINDICVELNIQEWQLDKIIRNSNKYKTKEIEDRLIELANLDLNIKSGKIDKWLGLAKFIVDSAE